MCCRSLLQQAFLTKFQTVKLKKKLKKYKTESQFLQKKTLKFFCLNTQHFAQDFNVSELSKSKKKSWNVLKIPSNFLPKTQGFWPQNSSYRTLEHIQVFWFLFKNKACFTARSVISINRIKTHETHSHLEHFYCTQQHLQLKNTRFKVCLLATLLLSFCL